MENISHEFAANQEEENVYRALRDSVLQLHNFVAETARKANPAYLVDISWDIRDHSLINWISFSRCFLIRTGNKIQFLSKPRFLENISIELHKGDKILICSDSLVENYSDSQLDEIVKASENVDDACQRLLHLSNDSFGNPGEVNIVVMEVREPSANVMRVAEGDPKSIAETTEKVTKSVAEQAKKSTTPAWWLVPVFLAIAGLAYWLLKDNRLSSLLSADSNAADAANLQDTVYYFKKDTADQQKIGAATTQTPIKVDTAKNAFPEEKTTNITSEKQKQPETTTQWDEPKEKTVGKTTTKPIQEQPKTAEFQEKVKPKRTEASSQAREALIGQQARWKKIRDDLQAEANAGKNVEEELKNAKEVLQRIERKLKEMNY